MKYSNSFSNNKGFSPLLILVLILSLFLVAGLSFNYFSKNEVLSTTSFDVINLAQNLSTKPGQPVSKDLIEYSYYPSFNKNYEGNIRVSIKSNSPQIVNLMSRIRNNGVMIEEYCNFSNCPIRKNIKPSRITQDLSRGVFYEFNIPVNSSTKSLNISLCKSNEKECNGFSVSGNNAVKGWNLDLSSTVITRVSEAAIVDVNFVRNVGNQQTYEVIIKGVGESANSIVKTLRLRGLKRIDGVNYESARTTVLKPAVQVNDGFFKFTVNALPETLTFYVDSIDTNLNVKAGKVPQGWKVNGKGDGLDRDIKISSTAVVDIALRGSQGKNQLFEVTVRGSGNGASEIRDIITSSGVVRLDGPNYNQSRVTVLRPTIRNFNGYFTFTVVAQPDTLTFFVNSPSIYVDAKPGKIPAGWRINNKMDGLDRIRR